MYVKTYDEAAACLNTVREYIINVEMLPLNQKKTGIFQGLNRKYLGYRFEEKNKKILIKKRIKLIGLILTTKNKGICLAAENLIK